MPEGHVGESDADAIRPGQNRSGTFFPRWVNYLLPLLVLGVLGAGLYVPVLIFTGLSPQTLGNVGYNPDQPIPYSHALHVGELGMDCRHCHYTVDKAAFAAIPPTETCIACHNPGDGAGVGKEWPSLIPLHESYENGTPIQWIKVHDLADYAYFNHSAHVLNGVGCVTCHGRVDRMGEEGVHQAQPLSMAWCLDCHRQPEQYLRPNSEITNMTWTPLQDPRVQEKIASGELENDEAAAQRWLGEQLLSEYDVHEAAYMQQCSTCHR